MLPSELKTLIESDSVASELAAAGNDAGCAERCSSIAPAVYRECKLRRLGLLALFPNPEDGYEALSTLESVAQSNPVVAEVLAAMSPMAPVDAIPDFGLDSIRSFILSLSGSGVLRSELASVILSAGRQQPVVTASDVSRAMRGQ